MPGEHKGGLFGRYTVSDLINIVISLIIGTIVTARKFDRERQREYAVTVTATDQAADPLIGICQLNILILDQNDNSPKFENIRYECKYGEWEGLPQQSTATVK